MRGDSSTIFASSNVTTSATGATINVNQAISGPGAKTMTMGTLGTTSTAATYQVNFTGANNTSLSAGTLNTPASTIAAVHTINNNIASGGSLTLASVFNQATTIASPNLVFAGTGTTIITGAITQTLVDMDLIKNDAGTLLLNGTNTYTGLTSVNAGTLGGTGTIAGDVIVLAAGSLAPGASAGILSISGIGGLDISAQVNGGAGKLKFELGANTATSDQLAVTGTLTTGGLLGFSDFSFTNLAGGPQNGTYVLITTGAAPTGTLDGSNLSGPIGAGGTGLLSVSGNNIVMTVSGLTGGITFADWKTANSTAGGLADDHDGDGVDNGTEFFIYGPVANSSFTALPGVTNTLGTLSVTWVKAAGYPGTYGTDFRVETSDTLTGTWTQEDVSPTPGATVTIFGNNVTYTFPSPLGTKKFARLKVTGP